MNTQKKRYTIDLDRLIYEIENSTPNTDQVSVLKDLLYWFNSWSGHENQKQPATVAALAGSGKSYLFSLFVMSIIQYLYCQGSIQYQDEFQLTLVAPSNTAADIMRRFSQDSGLWRFCKVRVMTVHSWSGVVMGELDDKAERLEHLRDGDLDSDTVTNQLVIVDEYGMISDNLYSKRLAAFTEVPILYLGNLEQLSPPDNTGRLPGTSIIDEQHTRNYFTLNTAMRNKGSILEYSQQLLQQYHLADLKYSPLITKMVAHGLDPRFSTTIQDVKKSVLLPFQTDDNLIVARKSDILSHLTKEGIISSRLLKEDPSFFRVMAYTNASVQNWNTVIRKIIFGEDSRQIHVGETFLVKAPIYDILDGQQVKIFFTNQYIKLTQVELVQVDLIDRFSIPKCCVKFPGIHLDFYSLTAVNRYGYSKSFLYPTTRTMDLLSRFMLGWWKIIEKKRDSYYRKTQYNFWEKTLVYYGLKYKEEKEDRRKENDIPFTRLVIPAYAATIHSCQGGSIDHVILDTEDISNKARSMDTRLRLNYVGASRAKQNLYLCTGTE